MLLDPVEADHEQLLLHAEVQDDQEDNLRMFNLQENSVHFCKIRRQFDPGC